MFLGLNVVKEIFIFKIIDCLSGCFNSFFWLMAVDLLCVGKIFIFYK